MTLSKWLCAADVEDGVKPGPTSDQLAELRELKRRSRLLPSALLRVARRPGHDAEWTQAHRANAIFDAKATTRSSVTGSCSMRPVTSGSSSPRHPSKSGREVDLAMSLARGLTAMG